MSLYQVQIGVRIRKIREEKFKETRPVFSERCKITDTHLGQIERGEIMPSIKALDKIACSCGETLDYILYGKNYSNTVRKNIDVFLDRSNPSELNMFFQVMCSIKGYTIGFEKPKTQYL